MTNKTVLTKDDILDIDQYDKIRNTKRSEIISKKKLRQVSVGPYVTFYFESYETIWYQVQEMLRIEKGGHDQLVEELEAYNPLIPNGSELVATVMIEIDNPSIRKVVLGSLGGIENNMVMQIGEEVITAEPEMDLERTNADGKASSVQFIHFKLSDHQVQMFKDLKIKIQIGINHPKYGHMAIVSDETRQALNSDFI